MIDTFAVGCNIISIIIILILIYTYRKLNRCFDVVENKLIEEYRRARKLEKLNRDLVNQQNKVGYASVERRALKKLSSRIEVDEQDNVVNQDRIKIALTYEMVDLIKDNIKVEQQKGLFGRTEYYGTLTILDMDKVDNVSQSSQP